MELLKRGGTLVGAAVLVLAVYFSGPGTDEPNVEPAGLPPELIEEPDVYLKDATITEFEPTGSPKFKLFASRMDRFDKESLTRLQAPTLDMSSAESQPWAIRSERGTVTRDPASNEDVVHLNDDVVLRQIQPDTGATQLTIRSTALTVHPHRQYAETDQDVMIDTAVGRTLASGMQGNLKAGLMHLSPEGLNAAENGANEPPVHTIILPQQFKDVDDGTAETETP